MMIQPPYLPTPREIALECERIRSHWTPAERQRRLQGYTAALCHLAWVPPVIDTSACGSSVRKVLSEQSA